MANEIKTTDLAASGGLVAETLSALILERLYDPTDLRSVATLIPYQGGGSTSQAVTQDAIPSAFSSVAEAAAVGNSAYATSEFVLNVGRYSQSYEMTDLVPVAGSPINLERAVSKLDQGVALTFTDLITALLPGFSSSVGSTGVNLSVDDLFSAMFALNLANAGGNAAAVLHPQQINDLKDSMRTETGTFQFEAATAAMLASKGPGFVGRWMGIDFWQSDSVELVNAGADRNGALIVPGAIGWTMAPVALMQKHVPTQNIIAQTPELLVELVRDGKSGMSSVVAHMYPGVVEIEDARGVGIITDA